MRSTGNAAILRRLSLLVIGMVKNKPEPHKSFAPAK